jgi:hypothetical protein
MIIAPGTTSQSIDVQIVDDTGLAVTGLVASSFPAVSWSLGGNTAATSITLSDLALITTAYSSGGVKERSGGYYRLDLPNAAIATTGTVKLIGEASGKHLIAEPIVVGGANSVPTVGTGTGQIQPSGGGVTAVNPPGYDATHTKSPWPNATAWVNFDEGSGASAADATGNGNGFTLVNTPTWATTDSGKFNERFSSGSYLAFNGTTQYMTGAGTVLNTVPDAWALVFRFSPAVTPAASKRLANKFNLDSRDGDYHGFDLFFDNAASGALKAVIYPGFAGNFSLLGLNTTWTVGRWYQLVLQYGKDKGYELWLDDVLEARSATTTKPNNGSRNPLTLGAQNQDGSISNYFNGSIDNVRVFPAFLNPQQIAALARQEPTYPQHAAEDRVTTYGGVILPGTGDQSSCQEANVVYTSGVGFEALVHCGWTTGHYRYASSTDGTTWTLGADKLGNGSGGESSADVGRGSIVLKGGTYYKFYDIASAGVKYATASSMAGTWATQGTIVANAAVSAYGSRIVGPAAYWDADRSLWIMVAQVYDGGGIWRSILLTGATLGTLAIDTTAGLLADLQAGSGMYGGYYLTKLRDGRYCLLYHTSSGPGTNLPTIGRAATSWDGRRWTQYPIPLRQIRGEIANQQQESDFYAVEANGTLYLFNSLVDNVGQAAQIAVMTFAGTLDDYLIDGPQVDAGSGRLSTVFTAPRQAILASRQVITDALQRAPAGTAASGSAMDYAAKGLKVAQANSRQ